VPKRQAEFQNLKAWMTAWYRKERFSCLGNLWGNRKLDRKHELHHHQNCGGLLALKILKVIKECLN